ncbi:hypothetical protein ES705_50801 [subsurface metagenome]
MKHTQFVQRVLTGLFICAISVQSKAGIEVALVIEPNLEAPALHGLKKLEQALQNKGHSVTFSPDVVSASADLIILAGKATTDGSSVKMLKVLNVSVPDGPETLVIQRMELKGTPALILCGSDAVGLMYAALDVADRISWTDSGELKNYFHFPQNNYYYTFSSGNTLFIVLDGGEDKPDSDIEYSELIIMNNNCRMELSIDSSGIKVTTIDINKKVLSQLIFEK